MIQSDLIGKTIYAPTKTGNVKTWCCHILNCADGSAELQIISQTKLDGKPVVRVDRVTEGKNIGKANETTPWEQALSEARSRYNKKLDQGYKTEIPTDTSKANTNSLDLPKPMLAHPIDKVKKVEFPAWWQTKLDGHRAIVTRRDGELIMYSRQGKLITSMGHILHYLNERVEEGCFLDGELYLHGEALQNITSLIKREQEASKDVIYYVYDMILDVPFEQRAEKINDILGDTAEAARMLSTYPVTSMNEVMDYTQQAVDNGYEGGILRTPDQGYEAGFRSRTLLKIKSFEDREFTIVGVVEGKDRIVNDTHLKVAVFNCVTDEGVEFDVLAPGDQYDKDRAWHERDQYPGKRLTVKHLGWTKERKPWHPTAVRIREDI